MRLIEKTGQYRRDFWGNYECEGCGNVEEICGYDDRNFHDNVMPAKECSKCGKSTNDLGIEKIRVATKYPEGMHI
jgi:hypothetical protein